MSDIPTNETRLQRLSTNYLLLLVAIVAQAVTFWITWPLWNARTDIPHLPVFETGIPQFSFGWLLLGSLLIVAIRPRFGVWLHFAVLLIATLFDQMRAQPQFLANWVLMLVTVGDLWKNYTRWFLVSLWFWAGLHKLLSPEWHTFRAFDSALAMGFDAVTWYPFVAVAIAASEIVVGLLAWFKPKWGAIACVMLHLGIVVYLSPWVLNWNYSVIPWNLASAIVGAWVLWTCAAKPTATQRVTFAAMMIIPAGFYWGLVDHGYAHVLYSGSVPRGLITRVDGSLEEIDGWGELAIPFPSERRTLQQRFAADSKLGDRLHILDPREALQDLHFIKQDSGVRSIERDEFFSADHQNRFGVELDSTTHVFLLSIVGAQMKSRSEEEMIFAIEFKPDRFKPEQLTYLRHLPNLEQVQLSNTSVSDDDLRALADLPRLTAIGLRNSAITDRGIEILSRSKSLRLINVSGTEVSDKAMEHFQLSREIEQR